MGLGHLALFGPVGLEALQGSPGIQVRQGPGEPSKRVTDEIRATTILLLLVIHYGP